MNPDLPDLLATVRDFLQRLTPTLSGEARYEAQVSAFLLDVVARNVTRGAGTRDVSRSRLSQFLGVEGEGDSLRAELCAAIRAGRLDGRWDETLALVLAETVDQVGLTRPDHLAPDHAGDWPEAPR